MKKVFNILFVACGLLAFTACDDDVENPYATESTMSVVSADLDFEPAASQGSIVFTSTGGTVTVTSPASWCTPTLRGDSVLVSVDENTSVSGRSTVVVLHNGNDSLQVVLTQRGIVFSVSDTNMMTGDAATRMVATYNANLDVAITSAPDWAKTTLTGDSILVDFTENNTGHARVGYLVLNAGAVKDSIKIGQADFDKDIAGTYNFYYRESADGPGRNISVQLSENQMRLTPFGLNLPLAYDPETISFTLNSATYIGRYGSYYIYSAFMAGNYWTQYSNESSMSLLISYDDVNGTTGTFTGSILSPEGVLPYDGFLFEAFSSQSMSQQTDQGALMSFYAPRLQRAPSSAASNSLK